MPWRKGNKLKVVPEAEAQGRIAEIYREIKEALGVPHVNVIFQAYAVYPEFLERFWGAARPVLQTREFFQLADRIGAEAYTRMHNYFGIPDLCAEMTRRGLSEDARQELTQTVELFHYNNPPLLLLAAAQLQAFESRIGHDGRGTASPEHPVFREKPVLIEEQEAPPSIRRIYDDIRRTFGLPLVNTDYRAFARWPDFLEAYWAVLKPVSQSPVYLECQQGVRESAWNLSRELPVPLELSASQLTDEGVSDERVSDVFRITELFVQALSGLVLNVAVAKIGLEGGTRRVRRASSDEEQAA